MKHGCRLVACGFLCWLLASAGTAVHADEVSIPFQNLTLNANLELAEGRNFSDGMVLILHGIWGHNQLEIVTSTQQALLDIGRSSLAVNLSLGVDDRHGFYDCDIDHNHLLEDSIDEIQAWVNWLKHQGSSQVILLGHSFGANQIMVYVAERSDPVISHLVFLAPNTITSFCESNLRRYGESCEASLEKARTMIEQGHGDKYMEQTDFMFCPKSRITANTYFSYYSPQKDARFNNFPAYLSDLEIPTLITSGTADERQPHIVDHVFPYIDGKTIQLSVIEGAGHFFRDFNIEEAMEAAVAFLDSNQN